MSVEVFPAVLVPRELEGLVTFVLSDPFLDILLVAELRDALELDRLRFSFELVALLIPLFLGAVDVGVEGLLRLVAECEFLMLTVLGLVAVRPSIVLVERRGDSRLVDLFRDRVEELILGWLPRGLPRAPRLRFVIGFRSEKSELELMLRGFVTVRVDDGCVSSLPFLKFFDISLEKSRILLRVPRGFSGGKLVALDGLLTVRLDVEALVSFARDGLEPFKFDLLVDFPFLSLEANLSNTFEPDARRGSLTEADRESLSMIEFFLVTGFFKSLSECPGRIFPFVVASPSAVSTLMMGTDVTYFPSTRVES